MHLITLLIPISWTVALQVNNNDTCVGLDCQNTISIPLIDNMKARLMADLDVTEMNKILKMYIQNEIDKGIETSLNANLARRAMDIEHTITNKMTELVNKKTEEIEVKMNAKKDTSKDGLPVIMTQEPGNYCYIYVNQHIDQNISRSSLNVLSSSTRYLYFI